MAFEPRPESTRSMRHESIQGKNSPGWRHSKYKEPKDKFLNQYLVKTTVEENGL